MEVQDELRWGDPSQLFKGHDSSDLESRGKKEGEKQIERRAETKAERKKCLGNKLKFVY